jgi:hypothetical protein
MTRNWRPHVTVTDHKARTRKTVQVEVEINWQALAKLLGQAAMDSKRGKSTALKGALKCKLYETKKAKREKRKLNFSIERGLQAAGATPLTELDDLILGRKTLQQVVEDAPK